MSKLSRIFDDSARIVLLSRDCDGPEEVAVLELAAEEDVGD